MNKNVEKRERIQQAMAKLDIQKTDSLSIPGNHKGVQFFNPKKPNKIKMTYEKDSMTQDFAFVSNFSNNNLKSALKTEDLDETIRNFD